MARSQPALRIGTSGYQYDHWRGLIYPKDLPRARWFDYYAERFDTVEINNTFYQLPSTRTFRAWKEAAPPGFCYAVKFSRYGSHLKRLKAPRGLVRTFLGRARHLGPTLGPILVQLPPGWDANPERLAAFLAAAPAANRWAVEFRDPRWLCDAVYEILAAHGAALCIHDLIPDHPRELTARWTYLRYHGQAYGGSYSSQYLTAEARRIGRYLADGLDVFAYFNNDLEGHAIRNALDLCRFVLGAGGGVPHGAYRARVRADPQG
jgi:uncharacterized protein YecE (DUF72 family)